MIDFLQHSMKWIAYRTLFFIAMYYLTRKTSLNIRFRWENTFISTYNSYCCTYDYDFSVITIKNVPDIILYIGYSNCLDSMKSWFCKKEQSAKENKQNNLLILHYKNPPKYKITDISNSFLATVAKFKMQK